MNKELRRGPLKELSKLIEQDELEADTKGKPVVVILRQEEDGTHTEVFNSYRGINAATIPEIEFAIRNENKIGEDIGNPKARERRLNILRDALIEKKAELEKMVIPAESGVSAKIVASVVEQIMRPMLESMGAMMQRMSEAVEHIATAQDVMRNRLEALEKDNRLNTPVTDTQARYLADAARKKAAEIMLKKDIRDKKAITKLSGLIKKAVLRRYGKGSLREIPRCEYTVAMSQIDAWNNVMDVLDIVREARERAEIKNE